MVMGLRISHEERLRRLGIFSLERRGESLKSQPYIHSDKYLKSKCQGDSARVFPMTARGAVAINLKHKVPPQHKK